MDKKKGSLKKGQNNRRNSSNG